MGPLTLSSKFTRRAVEQFLWNEVKCLTNIMPKIQAIILGAGGYFPKMVK